MTVDLWQRAAAGDLRALARAATLIENGGPAGRELTAALFPQTGRALIAGITGPAGAGKSTLADQITLLARRQNKRVGIVAVDPSSPFSKGAILGDRIRMQRHHDDPGVFIRSMANRGRLGGVARGTLDIALLLDATGWDLVLIETVGAGQDDVEIARLADVTVVVLAPGLGDDVQAFKAGLMEIADVFAVNKADRPGADELERDIRAMQEIGTESRPAPVQQVIASQGVGVDRLLELIQTAAKERKKPQREIAAWSGRLREMVRDSVVDAIPERALTEHARRVAEKIEDPYAAADALRRLAAGHS